MMIYCLYEPKTKITQLKIKAQRQNILTPIKLKGPTETEYIKCPNYSCKYEVNCHDQTMQGS